MLEVGQMVKLDNDKEYIVIERLNLHNVTYLYLITKSKPIEMIIVTEKIVNGELVLDEIKDNSELDYVLSKFSLNEEKEKENNLTRR